MIGLMQSAYLTVAEVASELGISKDGVYKLIRRGKLPAIRRSERGLRISRLALDAYQRRLQDGGVRLPPIEHRSASLDELRVEFERETGLSPAEWEQRWKADQIEDSAENMALAIRALGLLLYAQDEHGQPDGRADQRAQRPAA
jgi:excisionase family DNA binding protein